MSSVEERKQHIRDSIRVIPNWPKEGVMFQDVTTLLLNPVAFKDSIELFRERYAGMNIQAIAGFEARGLIFGAPLAIELGVAFIPLRKPKKLPGPVISEEYHLEYGTDRLEMHVGAVQPGQRVLLIDDLIATGGTLLAGARLMERAGATVVEAACVIELPELKGREKIGDKFPLYTLIDVEGI